MKQKRSIMRHSGAILFVWLWLCGVSHAGAQTADSAPGRSPLRVDITIKDRQFHPSPVSVPVGRQVVLVFNNQDVELHAFVPKSFLEHVALHVDGNGAPEFGEKGLVRVLIPSGGREEIHFVLKTVGTFEYRCDLPGHQMVGTIVVEEQRTVKQTAEEAGRDAAGQQ